MDFEEEADRFGINPLKLDTEWVGHSQMVYNAAAEKATAQKKLGEAKLRSKVVGAKLGQDIRDRPAVYGIGKATNDAVLECINKHDDFLAAEKEVIAAQYNVDMAEAACNALEHRKRALSLLVELWQHEYYSDPTPRPASIAASEFEKRAVRRRGIERRRELDGGDRDGDSHDDD